jgi:hypothetical protein
LRSLGDAKRRPERGRNCIAQRPGHVDVRKNLPQRHQLPREGAPFEVQKPIFYWVFPDGTALANQPMWK